jgi:hypothetical protein
MVQKLAVHVGCMWILSILCFSHLVLVSFSARIARQEDEEQLRLIEEEERREQERKRRKMARGR